jgi:hypothetical protein
MTVYKIFFFVIGLTSFCNKVKLPSLVSVHFRIRQKIDKNINCCKNYTDILYLLTGFKFELSIFRFPLTQIKKIMSNEKSKNPVQLYIGTAIAVLILSMITIYVGVKTARWTNFSGLDEARARLHELPLTIGDWKANGENELLEADVTSLQIQNGYISRRYKNTKTQFEVYITIMIGKTGIVVVHSPEICFGGRDYKKDEKGRIPVQFPILDFVGKPTDENTLWKVKFVNNSARGGVISFYYGASVGNGWVAEENPRMKFSGFRYAYKIQVQAAEDGQDDIAKMFLSDCLPTIQNYIVPCR